MSNLFAEKAVVAWRRSAGKLGRLGAIFLFVLLFSTLLFLATRVQAENLSLTLDQTGDSYSLVKFADRDVADIGMTVENTIDIFNHSGPTAVILEDGLPDEFVNVTVILSDTEYVTAGGYDAQQHQLRFEIDLPQGESTRIVYTAEIGQEALCHERMVNKAVLIPGGQQGGDPIAESEVELRRHCADLGDAPDSENHFGVEMSAYTGVKADFPTVYHKPLTSANGVGPFHQVTDVYYLGSGVSTEVEADIGPDQDPTNNLVPPRATANLDQEDNGLANPAQLSFNNCTFATIDVTLTFDPSKVPDIIPTPDQAYLNIWFDGNRDGDWDDVATCPQLVQDEFTHAFEHIVIDQPIALVTGPDTVSVRTSVPVLEGQDVAVAAAWLRVTLSGQPSPKIGDIDGIFYGDGRGIVTTLIDPQNDRVVPGYFLGETEDYLLRPAVTQPELSVIKSVDQLNASLNDQVTYTVSIDNPGQNAVDVVFEDKIPFGSGYLSSSFTASVVGNASGYDNLNEVVYWEGRIPAQTTLNISFVVVVNRCTPPNTNGFDLINAAYVVDKGSGAVYPSNDVTTDIAPCTEERPPDFVTKKSVTPAEVKPGEAVSFTLSYNNPFTDALRIKLIDALPDGVIVDPASLPNGVFEAEPGLLVWENGSPTVGEQSISFRAKVDRSECDDRVINQAEWKVLFPNSVLEGKTNPAIITIRCPDIGDLGDAPDSSNHHGLDNTAYAPPSGSPILGQFPTVWGIAGPSTAPSGPFHRNPYKAHLGRAVSAEFDADLVPDVDGVTNILDGMTDLSNMDQFDDGWLNKGVFMQHCKETTLKVLVTKNDPAVDKMLLNVWFDGNRDGDWADKVECADVTFNDQQPGLTPIASEHIVDNFIVDMSGWDQGESREIIMRTRLIPNKFPDALGWVRFTLSSSEPPVNPGTKIPDGRGPDHPEAYDMGETEDYLVRTLQPQDGDPGILELEKLASSESITVGDRFTYTLILSHTVPQGQSMRDTVPAFTVLEDILPRAVKIVERPTVTELNASIAPFSTSTFGREGLPTVVRWEGSLTPGGALRIDIPVELEYCPVNFNDPEADPVIRNRAVAKQTDGTELVARKIHTINCEPPEAPTIVVHKRIERPFDDQDGNPDDQQVPDGPTNLTPPANPTEDEAAEVLPSRPVVFILEIFPNFSISETLTISDTMPEGLIATRAEPGAAIKDEGRVVYWEGEVGPATRPFRIKIRAEVTAEACGSELINVAKWATRFHDGESNRAIARLRCDDLGDAPDSTNHFNRTMNAYPGVVASFPTVFDDVDAPGPLHKEPFAAHLGRGVSLENEADRGPDIDPSNNIKVTRNVANLDRADDGLRLGELRLNHCQTASIPVTIFISQALVDRVANDPDFQLYLNVWLDGNRDGDWQDKEICPATATNDEAEALEHLVQDYEIDVATLGAGLHELLVATDGPVTWPEQFRSAPSWMRITLAEQTSPKPAGDTIFFGDGTYGDGRGPAGGYLIGETEDYIVRSYEDFDGYDLSVEKRGNIHPVFREGGSAAWELVWSARVRNEGLPATDIAIIDTLDDSLTYIDSETAPIRAASSYDPADHSVSTEIERLRDTGELHFIIKTTLPITTPPGTVITNTVEVTGANDFDPANNSDTFTATVPFLPPLIHFPTPGTTCTDTVTVTGRIQIPGAAVEVFVDGASVGTTTANGAGRWSLPVTGLSEGDHEITAQATFASQTSPTSPPVGVTVDTDLFWSPLSLRFEDEDGFVMRPHDENGETHETGWFVFLRPGKIYTASVFICCDDPNAEVTITVGDEISGTGEIDLTDPDGDRIFEATFTMPEGAATTAQAGAVELCVLCDLIIECSDGSVLIDPEGTVYDATIGLSAPIEGAEVTCFEATEDEETSEISFTEWPATDFDQINPQTVGTDGYFSFFTPAGTYRLKVTADGYQPFRSPDLVVTDAPVHYDVPLRPIVSGDADAGSAISAEGFDEPEFERQAGEIFEWINVDTEDHQLTIIRTTTSRAGQQTTETIDTGLLGLGDSFKLTLEAGTYTVTDVENPLFEATITVGAAGTDLYLPIVQAR